MTPTEIIPPDRHLERLKAAYHRYRNAADTMKRLGELKKAEELERAALRILQKIKRLS